MIIVNKVLYRVSQKRKRSNGGLQIISNRIFGVKALPYLLTVATTGSEVIWNVGRGPCRSFWFLFGVFFVTPYTLWVEKTFFHFRIHWRRCKTVSCAEQTDRTGRGQNPVHINVDEMCLLIELFLFGTDSFCGKPFREEEYRGEKCEEKAQWEHPVKFELYFKWHPQYSNFSVQKAHVSIYISH